MTTTNYLLISRILTYNLVIKVTIIGIIVIRITQIEKHKKQGNGFALLFLKRVSNFVIFSL